MENFRGYYSWDNPPISLLALCYSDHQTAQMKKASVSFHYAQPFPQNDN